MRPAFLHHLVQTWAADPDRQARRFASCQAPTPAATPETEARHATRPACR